jgi:hypothetical protein
MDATVAAALTTGVTDWGAALLAQFASLLPIALGIAITVGVAFAVIRYFRGIVNV